MNYRPETSTNMETAQKPGISAPVSNTLRHTERSILFHVTWREESGLCENRPASQLRCKGGRPTRSCGAKRLYMLVAGVQMATFDFAHSPLNSRQSSAILFLRPFAIPLTLFIMKLFP